MPVIHWCMDFRELNLATSELKVSLPTIQENLGALSGARSFLSLDSSNAYFSIVSDHKCLKYLSFWALGKIYQYLALPFGLKNMAAFYTMMVQKIIDSLKSEIRDKVISYLDDILIFSKNRARTCCNS